MLGVPEIIQHQWSPPPPMSKDGPEGFWKLLAGLSICDEIRGACLVWRWNQYPWEKCLPVNQEA